MNKYRIALRVIFEIEASDEERAQLRIINQLKNLMPVHLEVLTTTKPVQKYDLKTNFNMYSPENQKACTSLMFLILDKCKDGKDFFDLTEEMKERINPEELAIIVSRLVDMKMLKIGENLL